MLQKGVSRDGSNNKDITIFITICYTNRYIYNEHLINALNCAWRGSKNIAWITGSPKIFAPATFSSPWFPVAVRRDQEEKDE
jgi:hypothetical protein